MGGGGGDTVTNTGLGDDQYQTLADNQVGISGQITAADDAATKRYDAFDNTLGTINTNALAAKNNAASATSNASFAKTYSKNAMDAIGSGGSNPTGLYRQFFDQNTNLDAISNQNAGLAKSVGTINTGLASAERNIISGQGDLNKANQNRFDAVDTGLATNFDAVGDVSDQVTDVENISDRIDNNTQDLSTDLSSLSTDQAAGFDDASDQLDEGFEGAQDSRQGFADAGAEARRNLSDDLATVGDNQADFYGDLAGTLSDIENTNDTYVSDFDDYVDRYKDDISAASKDRSNILTGTEDAFGRLRTDLGKYTQAVSGYSADTDDALETGFAGLGDSVEGGFSDLGDDVAEGFIDVEDTVETEVDNLDLPTRLRTLQDNLGDRLGELDEDIGAEFDLVSDAFNDQGDLIEDEIDANGDLVTREIDAQGNLITKKFSAQGDLIASSENNIFNTLSDVETALGAGQATLMSGIEGTGLNIDDAITSQYNSLSAELAAQGVDISGVLQNGFDANSGSLDANAKSLLTLGSQITGFDSSVTANFAAVSSAFDAQGNLIGSTIDELGNTVTNQIDAQGNLITTKFDAQGNQIDQTETNIQTTLTQASEAQMALQNDIADTLGGTLDSSATAMSAGFDAQNAVMSEQGQNLLAVGMSLDSMSDQQKADFQAVSSAFDAQGNLIRSGTDATGNLVEREMDANGILLQRSFDAQGNLLGETSLNVNDIMSGLTQLDSISGQIETGFGGVQKTLGDQTGLMSELSQEQSTEIQETQDQILGGFDETAGTMDTQIRDIAGVASQMSDLDMDMRQQFYQLGGAFDDNGELIKETVDENGNLIQRSIDTNGNILLRAFDQTGNEIGQNVVNIGRALGDLADLNTLPGANISMGNLSPALQATPQNDQPNVPVSGFMAPYTETS